MSDEHPVDPPVEIIDDQTTFSLSELCRACIVEAEFVEAMVDEGVLEPAGKLGCHWCFPSDSLRRTRITVHLQEDLGVNLAGAALALDLLERIDALDSRLHSLTDALGPSP